MCSNACSTHIMNMIHLCIISLPTSCVRPLRAPLTTPVSILIRFGDLTLIVFGRVHPWILRTIHTVPASSRSRVRLYYTIVSVKTSCKIYRCPFSWEELQGVQHTVHASFLCLRIRCSQKTFWLRLKLEWPSLELSLDLPLWRGNFHVGQILLFDVDNLEW